MAGPGAAHSFQSALADLLPAETLAAEADEPTETKTVITGVAIPVPATAPDKPPLTLALTRPQPAAQAPSAPVPASEFISFPPAAPYQAIAPPDPNGIGPEVAKTPARPKLIELVKPPMVPEDPISGPELKNVAFSERFTPARIGAASDQPLSPPSIGPGSARQMPASPASKPLSRSAPAAKAAALPGSAGTAAVVSADRKEQTGPRMEQRQDQYDEDKHSFPPPARAPADEAPGVRQQVRTETLSPSTMAAAPSYPETTPAAPSKSVEARVAEAEPIAPAPSPAAHGASSEAHSVSLRVTDAAEQRVELKITERQGELHVSVRSADADLAGSLRENLGDLLHKLEQSGWRAESWHPPQAGASTGNDTGRHTENEFADGRQSGQQQHDSNRDRRRGRDQDAERDRWAAEIENTFASDPERKIWFPA